MSQLSDAWAKVASHYQLVQTNSQRWQASEQEVQARLAEYQGGRTPVNVVLQSQLRRAQAQIDYYRALAEYNKSINFVHYLRGTLLQHNNIEIAEGPWQSKAYWDALERARERSAGRKWQYGVSRPEVVRQGAIADPQTAATGGHFVGDEPTLLPPGDISFDSSVGLQDALGQPIDRHPVPVNDIPLTRLQSPAEILTQRAPTVSQAGGTVAVQPVQHAGGPRTATGSPVVGSGVKPGQSAVSGNGVVATADGYAPAPVRKKTPWVPQN